MRKKIIAALILGAVAISWFMLLSGRRRLILPAAQAVMERSVSSILKGLLPGARAAAGFLEVWEALNQLLRC